MSGLVQRTLEAIDWDFAQPRSGYVPPPHWYPGTFVPALSDALVEALSPTGGVVFDPYCGIGTTGWSSVRHARSCHLADLNPVALLVAYATTSLLALARADSTCANGALGALGRAIGRNDDLFGRGGLATELPDLDAVVETLCSPSPGEMLSRVVAGPPRWDALDAWMAPQTLAELAESMDKVQQSSSAYVRLLGACMISATARSLNSQHASWGHIADNVRPSELTSQNVHAATTRWLKRTKAFLGTALAGGTPDGAPSATADIHLRDWSKPGPDATGAGHADLLLSSPPYADAIDYTLSQRLSLYLLGYDDAAVQALVSGEIGARRKRFKSGSRGVWSEQLCEALRTQVRWVRPNGAICLILPHKDAGRGEGEDDLKAALGALGWRIFFERHRSIHQSHTRQSWTSIKKETILAFKAA